MPRSAVVYLLLGVAFLVLLSLSRPTHPGRGQRRNGRRLARAHHHAIFDPLVDQLERRGDERGLLDVATFKAKLNAALTQKPEYWRKLPDVIGVLEEYFGEEGQLNLTERLDYLFPLLDRFPTDGAVDFHELEMWNQRQALDQLFYSTERTMKLHDKNGDGAVSLREFLSYLSDEAIDWNDMNNQKPGWWKVRFNKADADGDGLLNQSELNDFLHPEDSRNLDVQMWLQKENLREMDENKDGKLSLQEFSRKAQQIYPSYDKPKLDDNLQPKKVEENDYVRKPKLDIGKEFIKLDADDDKFLSAEELKPILHRLQPGELSHATDYTKYLIDEADDNKDGKLTQKEMLNHQFAFYNTVFEEEQHDDEYDDYGYHDELR